MRDSQRVRARLCYKAQLYEALCMQQRVTAGARCICDALCQPPGCACRSAAHSKTRFDISQALNQAPDLSSKQGNQNLPSPADVIHRVRKDWLEATTISVLVAVINHVYDTDLLSK